MVIEKARSGDEMTVEKKLKLLFELQLVDSKIDDIKRLRGELPLEVGDLEDEIEGLETRIKKIQEEIKSLNSAITGKKSEIGHSEELIKKYLDQQQKVRNNREFDALSKEIEYQKLEIELSNKRMKEYSEQIKNKEIILDEARSAIIERQEDLKHKKQELDAIVVETKKDEDALIKKSGEIEKLIESRLLNAFKRIRKNARNGLAVVTIERNACGGCFNKIPPQRQLDIATRKKIIVCEYCGRILVDEQLGVEVDEELSLV